MPVELLDSPLARGDWLDGGAPAAVDRARGSRILVAAEGSGGHLIPALEVAHALAASNCSVTLLYAQRASTAALMDVLVRRAQTALIHLDPVALVRPRRRLLRPLARAWQAGQVWRLARERMRTFRPDVLVGFGGWFCIPAAAAARQHGVAVLIHEQNVTLGRANRFLLQRRWIDQLLVSFEESLKENLGVPAAVTGLPIRPSIGQGDREAAVRRFGFDPRAFTVLVVGGSQGSRTLNRVVIDGLADLSEEERAGWQFIHLTGSEDESMVEQAYAAAHVRRWVAAHVEEMAEALCLADVVVARSGASTIAELAQCGTPAVLIPYPYASAHQRENARLVESIGAGLCLEESAATPERLFKALRQLRADRRLRRIMGLQMRTFAHPQATQWLAAMVVNAAQRYGAR